MSKSQSFLNAKILELSVLNNISTLEHAHRDIELIYVIKGQLLLNLNGNAYKLLESNIFLINSNQFHSFQSNHDNLFVIIHFSYDELIYILQQRNLLFSIEEANNEVIYSLKVAIEELLSVYMKQSIDAHLEYLEKAYKLSSILTAKCLSNKKNQQLENNFVKKGQNERLADILDYIQSNYREPLSLDDMAKLYFLSSPYLSKFFKKRTGKTFSQYLNEVRLAHSVNDLLNSDKPITRVALDNGFSNPAAFNRVFNEKYLTTPVKYRKQMNENECGKTVEGFKDSKEAVWKLRKYLDDIVVKDKNISTVDCSTSTNRKTVSINTVKPVSKYWNKLINLGYAKDLLNSDMQEQIKLIQDEFGFSYGRFWGLFGDDMLVEDRSGEKITYNFTNTNKLLDFLMQNKLKPFIEIGPKPKILSKTIEEKVIIQTISEKSSREWRNLTRSFLLQCVERYGIEEVETWYFEIWKFPELFNEETANSLTKKNTKNVPHPYNLEGYFRIFNGFKRTASEIVPSLKVGGCGLSMDIEGDMLEPMLQQWMQQEYTPDFLSFSLFPIEIHSNKRNIPIKNLHSGNPDFVKNKLNQIGKTLKKLGLNELEINVTEWNISISNRNLLNDSCYKAPYMVKNIIDILKDTKVNMLGYWLASDLFSDFRDSKNFLYGGAGLLTKNGIQKPSYHALFLLKQIGDSLLSQGENYIVTKKVGERYQVLCFNYKNLKYSYYLKPEGSAGIYEQYDLFEDTEVIDSEIVIQGIKNGKYRIKEMKLNRENGSVLDAWLKFGAIDEVKLDEVKYLRKICVPYMKVRHEIVEKQSILLKARLEPHEVRLFEVNIVFE